MLFDEPETIDTDPSLGVRVASTDETRARYQLLRGKRQGSTWQDGRHLYSYGPTGVTVYDLTKWG